MSDEYDICETKHVRARKRHFCAECQAPIKPGDICRVQDSLHYEHSWSHDYFCIGCDDLIRLLYDLPDFGGWTIGALHDEFHYLEVDDVPEVIAFRNRKEHWTARQGRGPVS
ncbi:MAG: hypothetical protein MI755_16485 [Sphingomonadales bacterium]|nr:hypothetical protein [Sphingomonadales bacterium]